MPLLTEAIDSIQTALQNASVLVRSLLSLGRSSSSPVLNTHPSSSNVALPPHHDAQSDRSRTEYMNRLAGAIQRNIRVRYELDPSEVIHA
jgi:rapamycin-insensitive companion of mTOR